MTNQNAYNSTTKFQLTNFNKMKQETMEYEEEDRTDYSRAGAVKIAQEILEQDDLFAENLLNFVYSTQDDHILVLILNRSWIDKYGIVLAEEIMSQMASFNLSSGAKRRDTELARDCIAFHFKNSEEKERCRDQVLQKYPQAFALSANALAAGFALPHAPTISMGCTLVLFKISPEINYVGQMNFFDL